MLWCTHKAFIRGIFIQTCSRIKKQRSLQLDKLIADIRVLESINKANPTHSSNITLSKLRTDLRLLLIKQHDKHLNALKLLNYSSGNKAEKFLANNFKTKKIQSRIAYLIDQHSKHKLANPQKIADAFASYYSFLYNLQNDPDTPQPQDSSIEQFLASFQLPTLTNAQLQALRVPITPQEINKAIRSLPLGKFPGPDGLSNDYYKQFPEILTPNLSTAFMAAMTSASFPPEMLQAYIVMIPKPGKEPTSPANYRLISLLNIDVKLYAKILAHRLTPILLTLIKPDKIVFVSERQASDATRRVLGIIQNAATGRVPSLLCYPWMRRRHSTSSTGNICTRLSLNLDLLGLYYLPSQHCAPRLLEYILPICFPVPSRCQMEPGRAAPCPHPSSIY